MSIRQNVAPLLALLLLGQAGYTDDGENPPEAFDRIWQSARLYENPDNKYVQEFSLIGRYHGQYWYVGTDQVNDTDWENRRMFFGFEAQLTDRVRLESQISVSEDFDPFYDGLYVTFLEWESEDATRTGSLGRLDYLYTGMERSTSSKRIATIERSLIVNQVMPGEVVGFHGIAALGKLGFHGGVYSGSIDDEFTDFDGGVAATLGISTPLVLDSFYGSMHIGSINLDYLYNDGDELNDAFEDYEHIVSLWHQGSSGPAGLGIDLTWAKGLGDVSNVWGFTLLPTWDVGHSVWIGGDLLQIAARYHYASSEEPGGLFFQDRYEQEVTMGMGDRYHAVYLGLNYLMYDHKLKLMAGAEYFHMSDVIGETGAITPTVDGWSFAAAVRLYF